RGLLILEVKDWRLDTIRQASKQTWEIIPGGVPKSVINPSEQARHYAHQVVDALCKDKQLVQPEGKWQGMLTFPWSYGVVFTHITRKQFDTAELHRAIEPHRVICADEMTESADAEELQSRLWGMFPTLMRGVLSLPQIDRVRWILFPEVRVPTQSSLFTSDEKADADALPDIMQVMDLQQEQLARSLGDGHRVIHGVAGSGKTMILGYRAEYLAKAASDGKPILVLCYNEPLAVKLASMMEAKGLNERVHVRNFHKWCRQQLVAFGQELPPNKMAVGAKMDDMVDRVIRAVDRKHIPSGQYLAVLIDEGHDFRPEWLKLVTQMVDPSTNSLLLLYDDAQSIYERQRSKQFSFKSV
ncbi:MAG: DNA helicase II, partial [Variovorax sp.]